MLAFCEHSLQKASRLCSQTHISETARLRALGTKFSPPTWPPVCVCESSTKKYFSTTVYKSLLDCARKLLSRKWLAGDRVESQRALISHRVYVSSDRNISNPESGNGILLGIGASPPVSGNSKLDTYTAVEIFCDVTEFQSHKALYFRYNFEP